MDTDFYCIQRRTVCRRQNLCLVCLVPFFPIYLFLRVEYLCCIVCALHINTPTSGLAKGQATAAHLPLPFSVCFHDRHLQACCAATVFLNSCFRALFSTSNPRCVDISLLPPPSPSVIALAFTISSASVILPSSSSLSTPSTPSLLSPSLLDSAAHLYCHLSLSRRHHLISSTPQDTSQHQCQYTDIYASPIFIIHAFSLVGDMASGPILSLSSLGTFLNLHIDADSTLHYASGLKSCTL